MKKTLCMGVVLTFVLTLCSCAISPGERYNNFIDDLDVVTRMEVALQQQKEGGMTAYVTADMETLEQDLSTLRTSDDELLRINENFVEATRLLRQSQAAVEQEDADAAKIACLKAKAYFDKGLRMIYLLPKNGGGSGE